MKNGRCRMHGGKARRKPLNGRYSLAAKAERGAARSLVRSIKSLIALADEELV
jgi:hypothetical protein